MSAQIESFSPAQRRLFNFYLVLTALLCGALVMEIEILGSRVIGPFFGASLFVWTSLITVALIALAAGYWVGGVLADRNGSANHLYGIILLSGFLVLLIPLLKGVVLKMALPLGLRTGALMSALLLFGPALLLLGCVSPYLVKIAAKEFHNIGRTVGGLYAISTFGSVVGTVLTGFYLIAHVGVNNTFYIIGTSLIVLSVLYFVLFNKKWYALGLLVIPALVIRPVPAEVLTLSDGTAVTQVFSRDTHYGNIKVVDYSYQERHVRELLIDGLTQGGIDMTTGMSTNRYIYFLRFLPYGMNPAGQDALVIGVGAGLIPTWYTEQGIRTDVVDIDPVIPEVAREYFNFRVDGEVIISDARHFLLSTRKQYDYIVLDAFSGDLTPSHLINLEMFQLLNARLRPQGILAINLIGSVRKHTLMTASVIKTLQAVFERVEIYPAFDVQTLDGIGNLEIIAYQGARLFPDKERISQFPINSAVEETVVKQLYQGFEFPPETTAMLLTDDYNPIDFYDSGIREAVRRRIIEFTDWDLLIR